MKKCGHSHNIYLNFLSKYLISNSWFGRIKKIINEIIELDNSDEKYLEFINRPPIADMSYFDEHYTLEAVAKNIDKVLNSKVQ